MVAPMITTHHSFMSTKAQLEHPDEAAPVRMLRCCCCGSRFYGRQFRNQDTGFGLGDCCVEFVSGREPDVLGTYGVPGVHYGVSEL